MLCRMGGDGFEALLFLGGFASLVLIAMGIGWYFEAKRTEALRAIAEEMGFEFHPRDALGLLVSLAGFPLTSDGSSKKIKNVLTGMTTTTQADLFDYSYTTGNGKSSTTHNQTVVRFVSMQLDLPMFSLRPKTMFHRIGTLFGYQAITFVEFPRFSHRWLLRGRNDTAIRRLFTEEILQFFEGHGDINVEAHGNCLLVYHAEKRAKPAKVRALLQEGLEVLAQFTPQLAHDVVSSDD